MAKPGLRRISLFQNPVGFGQASGKTGQIGLKVRSGFSLKSKEVVPKTEVLEQPHILTGNPLRPAGLAGLILALVLAWALVFFTVTRDGTLFPPAEDTASGFMKDLAGYDRAAPAEEPAGRGRRLDRLEKKAKTREERLSVLKRRRILAAEDPRFVQAYRESAIGAAKDFPFSEPAAAVAAEALLEAAFQGNSFTAEDRVLLNSYIPRLTQKRFYPLVLSIHILSGDMDDPADALALPNAGELFSADFSRLPEGTKNDMRLNGILLEILTGGAEGPPVLLGKLLGENPENRDILRLSAGYFYDYGHPLRAAELYSRLDGDESFALEADALYLAGEIPAARNIWKTLAASGGTGADVEISRRSLYNLAALSENEPEALSWLEKLFAVPKNGAQDGAAESAASVYGIIRYTRLRDVEQSAAILDDEDLAKNALLDLELLRRRYETWPPDRRAAEVWLLLGRHPGSGELFRWGAWFFDRQKLYDETAQLLKIASQQGIDGAWLRFHQGLALAREGKSAQAEKLLQEAFDAEGSGDWRYPANIARIQEGRRSVSAALQNYETAASLAADPRDAALIQLRISRCLEALGRTAESRGALEKAQALDPENLAVRRALAQYLN
jgi:tetratricopeptide (TPR) repeat protein